MIPSVNETLTEIFRRESPAVLATLVRLSGDFDKAEDALQEALVAAAGHWATSGIPPNPGGWLVITARRRMIDQHRRKTSGDFKERLIAASEVHDPSLAGEDRLMLLFTCCHPALNLEARVALTLRTVCGLTTKEIADAFLVPVPTMAQRIVRAKNKIKVAKIPYSIPDPEHWNYRLPAVLATIYVTFTQADGLHDNRGEELAEVTLELARLLNLLIPDESEIEGLLAMILLNQSRRNARWGSDGEAIRLEDQDRSLWEKEGIDEALNLLVAASSHGSVGQYWLQAAIAAEHIRPETLADRNWSAIVDLYDQLAEQTDKSPVVMLNRALALFQTSGATVALAEIQDVERELGDYIPFHTARAYLLAQLDQPDAAAAAYRQAIKLASPGPARNSLRQLLQEILAK